MEYEKLNKNAKKCMFVVAFIEFIIFNLIIIAILFFLKSKLPQIVKYIMEAVIVFNIIDLIISPNIRYKKYEYAITEDCIDIKEGFIFVERNIVPMERLQKIAIKKGPIDKIFNLAKVVITTSGGDVTIRFLDDKKSEFIAETLKKKINDIAIKSRKQNL